VSSVYEWEGKIEKATEYNLIVKSTVEKAGALKDFVKKEHPFDEPCIVSIPVDEENSSESFIEWIKNTAK